MGLEVWVMYPLMPNSIGKVNWLNPLTPSLVTEGAEGNSVPPAFPQCALSEETIKCPLIQKVKLKHSL